MNAQVSFLDGTYNLIHIPLDLYTGLLQPILRVLLPQTHSLGALPAASSAPESQALDSEGRHGFLSISVTPIECSIVCHTSWVKTVFDPVIKSLPRDAAKRVIVSKHPYLILSVISAGLDAAGRVMELTSPLALAGIPIFFISTYYSDFILAPVKDKQNVTQALKAKGFELSENQSDFVNAAAYGHNRVPSRTTSPPNTPPPSSVAELQTRAFDLLKKRNVTPYIDGDLALVQCSGRETSSQSEVFDHHLGRRRHDSGNGQPRTWVDTVDTKLYTCLVSALISRPRFMSVTLTQEDPPSLLLDRTLLAVFGDSLVGDTESRMIPIFLDLVELPLEVSGIVCGVAGKLIEYINVSSELSYLSTARAGAVILPEEQSKRALDILKPLLSKEP